MERQIAAWSILQEKKKLSQHAAVAESERFDAAVLALASNV